MGFEVSSVVRLCDGAIATSVENASCDYNYCYGVNVQGSLSCRLHSARIHHPSIEQK